MKGMQIESLSLSGFIYEDSDGDVFLLNKEKMKEAEEADYFSTYNLESIGVTVSNHFRKKVQVKPLQVEYCDWTTGSYVSYKDVFVRYYISESLVTLDEAEEAHIKKMAGCLEAEDRCDGYSEYTITESWTDIFVGGHDLREELKTHKGKYVVIQIDYKVPEKS
jgi:hypothetical protein